MSYQDLTGIVLAEIIGDFSFKQFANHGGMISFATGIIGYAGVVYFLIRSLQGSTVLLVNSAWDGISTLIEGVIAIIVYGEYFTSISQYVGFIFLIIGLFLLKIPLERKHKFVFPSFEHFITKKN